MAKPARRTSSPTSLQFDFNKVARKALQDHPELKKDILLVDVANDRYIASPRTLEMLNDDDDAQDELRKTVKLAQRLKTSYAQSIMIDQQKTIQAIVFHPDKYPLFDQQNRSIDYIGTIDHELGHLLAPKTHGIAGENSADAYAILRHLQRYEGQQTDVGFAAWKRVMVFIMSGKTSHLTTFTVDKILFDRQSADFISLTPAQTAAIARDYARKHTPSQKRLSALTADFNAARAKRINHDLFRRIGAITLAADPASDTFYLGARALLPALSNQPISLDGRTVTLTGAEWQKLRYQLERIIATLPANHPLQQADALRVAPARHKI